MTPERTCHVCGSTDSMTTGTQETGYDYNGNVTHKTSLECCDCEATWSVEWTRQVTNRQNDES